MKNRIIFILVFFAGFALFEYAEAAPYSLLQPIGQTRQVSDITGYIEMIVPFVLMLAAVLAVVQIVIGGLQWALSESITTKSEAKDRITQAIVGLLLALVSWLILNTINPDLVNLKPLGIPGLNISTAPTLNQQPQPQPPTLPPGTTRGQCPSPPPPGQTCTYAAFQDTCFCSPITTTPTPPPQAGAGPSGPIGCIIQGQGTVGCYQNQASCAAGCIVNGVRGVCNTSPICMNQR